MVPKARAMHSQTSKSSAQCSFQLRRQKLWSLKCSKRFTEPSGLSPQADMPTRLSDPMQADTRTRLSVRFYASRNAYTTVRTTFSYSLALTTLLEPHTHTHTQTTCFNALKNWLLTYKIIRIDHALQQKLERGNFKSSTRTSRGLMNLPVVV